MSVVRLIVATRSSGPPASGKIIKEMPGSVASGTLCMCICVYVCVYVCVCVCVVNSSQNVFPDFSVYVEIFWQSVVLLGGIMWGKKCMMSFHIVLLLFKLERHTLCFFFFLSLTLLFKFKNQ